MKKQNSNTQKLDDKAFVRLTVILVFSILLFVACLASSTYAWFTSNVSSNRNIIKAAPQFRLVIDVRVDDTLLQKNADGSTVITESGEYTVTVTLPQESSSGYCEIEVGDERYKSDYILKEDAPTELVFTLIVSQDYEFGDSGIIIAPRWGIYSGVSHVQDQGTLVIE